MRAEILGAFFNAVFLIALCLSIVLEAITRFIDPPEVFNPKLILIVGCLGLASNIAGFFVLGGHGHTHAPAEHEHDDHEHIHADEVRTAEEGRSEAVDITSREDIADEEGRVIDVLPEAAVRRFSMSSIRSSDSARDRRIKFASPEDAAKASEVSVSLGKYGKDNRPSMRSKYHNRRSNSISRLASSDINIHPASFRQEIIEASREPLDDIPSADDLDSPEDATAEPIEEPTEHSPLRSNPSGPNDYAYHTIRQDTWHVGHHHNEPKKGTEGGHSHSHGDMGMRAMVLHVIGDALGNVGVIVSALIIWLTSSPSRFYADPAVSLFITLIILRSAIPLTSATAKILLQATPDHLDVNDIKEDIQGIPGVVSCHHVHIWQLSDSQIIASMHIQVAFPISSSGGAERYMEVAKAIRKCLHAYGIHSATIQPEFCTDDHVDAGALGVDGGASPRALDVDDCLLGCVDNCLAKSCCATSLPTTVIGSHDSRTSQRSPGRGHAEEDDHDHGGHEHDHEGPSH